jgi:hypothetical protein
LSSTLLVVAQGDNGDNKGLTRQPKRCHHARMPSPTASKHDELFRRIKEVRAQAIESSSLPR